MQLNVQRGASHTGSQRLFEIHNETRTPGQKILRAVQFTPEGLARTVLQLVRDGSTVICIDQCREKHIKRLELLEQELPGDIRIHAVVWA
ncbi:MULTISPECIES: hypothetical protein [Pseudomonas]|jgi:hypothetical protein|uniref:hypothetical protein n=1 Tax=Pseudomonas TaxID=286 RepID=UPI000863683D|nr:hypothetical protein [Pseudomonas sp. NBRC 111126]